MALRLPATFWTWLGASCTLFAVSEPVFWSFFRPSDNVPELGITFLVYSVIAAFGLAVIRRYEVKSWPRMFLVGALLGWLAEGIVVDTAIGNATNPFPFSLSFTGLSWHALLSVVLGWWWLPRAYRADSPRQLISGCILFGMAWGLWAGYYGLEPGGGNVSFGAFAVHTAFTSGLLALGTILISPTPQAATRGDALTFYAVLALASAAWLLFLFSKNPLAASVLAALFG